MDEPSNPPLVYANRVIRKFLDNLFGSEVLTSQEDFLTIRTVFRTHGGLWEQVALGHPKHINFLVKVLALWAKQPERQRKTEQVY